VAGCHSGYSLYHPDDRAVQQHMACVAERGSFDDLPLAQITATLEQVYPGLHRNPGGDFAADAASKTER